ncbi:hypothetical protein BDQ94DRAFT_149281 [Aspergillus welwitschiae]|uniref:Uncharacterized protein n=1 Tax=Aspergillus welwitschiae TaxID=1341132 RepID=A0A3F3PTK5_9EURO|nr:hypothetical protein BDQ94DRAFT_149281 [Aspergillus welwitschiae]RDH30249.1 hypothetical protein BDQ94DRAFT_149281 [Aspergillus welwitschiae]
MMMDFQKHHPHHPYHTHPSMLGVVAHDPRAAPPAPPVRAYGPPPPSQPSSPRMFYDPFHRREPEMPRSGITPTYSYPPSSVPTSVAPVSYAHENAYAAYRTESNGYHTSSASHVSLKEQNLPGGNRESEHRPDPHYSVSHINKPERRMVYREGRQLAFSLDMISLQFILNCPMTTK